MCVGRNDKTELTDSHQQMAETKTKQQQLQQQNYLVVEVILTIVIVTGTYNMKRTYILGVEII